MEMEAACKKLNALEKKEKSGGTAILWGFGEYPTGQEIKQLAGLEV